MTNTHFSIKHALENETNTVNRVELCMQSYISDEKKLSQILTQTLSGVKRVEFRNSYFVAEALMSLFLDFQLFP